MPLIPRWRFMTDEAKALTKRTAVSAGVVLLVLSGVQGAVALAAAGACRLLDLDGRQQVVGCSWCRATKKADLSRTAR